MRREGGDPRQENEVSLYGDFQHEAALFSRAERTNGSGAGSGLGGTRVWVMRRRDWPGGNCPLALVYI